MSTTANKQAKQFSRTVWVSQNSTLPITGFIVSDMNAGALPVTPQLLLSHDNRHFLLKRDDAKDLANWILKTFGETA